jgi:hypothetical protein
MTIRIRQRLQKIEYFQLRPLSFVQPELNSRHLIQLQSAPLNNYISTHNKLNNYYLTKTVYQL